MSEERNLLITGAASGLGLAVHRAFGGTALVRGMSLENPRIRAARPFDAIVHCALNSTRPVTMRNAFRYLDDNFLLTQRLLDVPHRKFIYISTLDVYPRLARPIREDEDVDLSTLAGPYSSVKLFSDLLIQARAPDHLILRLATLLGRQMRRTVAWRLLTERGCHIDLSAEARFNYLLQYDVVSFIGLALEKDLSGIYNLASRDSVRLGDMARDLGLSATFGTEQYDIGPVDVSRASQLMPAFARRSWQTVNLFVDELGSVFVGNGKMDGG